MFTPSLPVWEPVLRAAAIYLALLLLLRVTGKRQVGQFTPFDLVLLLLVSEATSDALAGGDNSVTSALIAVATMLGLNLVVGWISTRSVRIERLLEGRPQFLIRNGTVDYRVLKREAMTKNDLLAALRDQGCTSPKEAEYAVLEMSGRISVSKRKSGAEN